MKEIYSRLYKISHFCVYCVEYRSKREIKKDSKWILGQYEVDNNVMS